MDVRKNVLSVLAGLLTLSVQASQTGNEKAQKQVSSAREEAQVALMKAVNFALTGTDDASVEAKDLSTCVFVRDNKATDYQHKIEVYFLNNVEASRIRITPIEQRFENNVSEVVSVRVTINGEEPVYEDRAINAFDAAFLDYIEATEKPAELEKYRSSARLRETAITLILQTREIDRVVRAWKYIYANGCKSAKSSF